MRLPLTRAQLGVWHAMRIDPGSAAYDIGGYAEIRGPVSAALLERAGARMVAEVDAFRTSFDDTTDPVTQVVAPAMPVPLHRRSFPSSPAALAWIRAELTRPRDPSRDPLVEIHLLKIDDQHHWWYVRSHHLILDGYSVPLVCGRVAQIYTALADGADPGPNPFAPYRLFTDVEAAYRASPDLAADRAFWLNRLAGPHEVPTLSARTGPPLGPFHRAVADLPEPIAARLLAPGRSWAPALIAAFADYLGTLTGARSLRLGMPMAGRTGALLRVPGNAANLLPLRVTRGAQPTEAAAEVAAELAEIRRHQRYRGEDLARDLGTTGVGPALFGPSVNIRDFNHALTFGRSETVLHDVTAGPVEDMTLSARREANHVGLYLDANAGAYDQAEVEQHLPRFVDHLAAFLTPSSRPSTSRPAAFPTPSPPTSSFPTSSSPAAGRPTSSSLAAGRPTSSSPGAGRPASSSLAAGRPASSSLAAGRPASSSLAAGRPASSSPAAGRPTSSSPAAVLPSLAVAFAVQAARTPDAIALTDGNHRLTFAELAADVAAQANALRHAGVGPEAVVALALPQNAGYVTAILAVATAGGAWLPLDPTHPPDHNARLLEAIRPTLTLTAGPDPLQAQPVPHPPATGPRVFSALARPPSGSPRPPVAWPVPVGGQAQPANLAYIVATSGSTGAPRPVAVTRAALANLLDSHRRTIMPAGERLRVAHAAPFTVDAALDPLLWMVAGHELVLLPVETYRDPFALVRAVREDRLDLVDVPPSYLRVLLDAGLLDPNHHRPSVVVFGGEAPPPDLWPRLTAVPGLRINAYGPTEFTVDALLARTPGVLGDPVAGTRALVLDAELRPVPPGGAGELYLGGPGLARGYAGHPAATATRFVADPAGPPGERLFRTGDLVRVRFDGELEFRGRADDQVKIRGFRVEPREVEAVLATHPSVSACAVVARPALVAYVVPRSRAWADLSEALLVHARERLPDHLVPAAIVPVAALPLAADGTLDRRSLPAPAVVASPYRPPATAAESVLCDCFSTVLDAEKVGTDDDFFARGGDSLLAARLVTAIRAALGADVALRTVFTHRTPRAIAGTLPPGGAE